MKYALVARHGVFLERKDKGKRKERERKEKGKRKERERKEKGKRKERERKEKGKRKERERRGRVIIYLRCIDGSRTFKWNMV